MREVAAFVDTLCFLHYPWLSNLDWCGMLEADAVEIVLAPVVVAELDKKKNEGTPKLRQRAKDALARIKDTLDKATLRGSLKPNVALSFVAQEPRIDFDAQGLSSGNGDDRLIATVIEYTGVHADSRIVLVTDDTGLTLKSLARGLTVKEMPQDQRLVDEPDAQAVESHRLKTALAEYENRLPRLRVVFGSEGDHRRFVLLRPVTDSPEEIASRLEGLKKKYQPYRKTPAHSALEIMRSSPFHVISDAEITRYNDALPKFFADMEKFFVASVKAENLVRRTIELNLQVENYGTAPGHDLLVLLHFPDGMMVCDKERRPAEPKAPDPPSPPRSQLDYLSYSPSLAGLYPSSGFNIPDVRRERNVGGPTIRRTNSFEVKFWIKKISHNLVVRLDALCVVFDSWASAKSFHIDSTIYTDSLPRPVEGLCHVIVEHGASS